jgi:phosphate transport system ATP-binding protein
VTLDRPMISLPERAAATGPVRGQSVSIRDLNAYYGKQKAISDINVDFEPGIVTAVIGPSGCGKSTLIRCINRMHEEIRGGSATGEVLIGGEDVYSPEAVPVRIRRRVGMVFQKPNPFTTMSIYDNVVAGLRLNGARASRRETDAIVEGTLRDVALWDEVRDKLRESGTALSGGQQQRLCIARAIAVKPEVLLLDEPCSALDPIATLKIEELLENLRREYTIILVTHNMQQAARVSEKTVFMMAEGAGGGRIVECEDTRRMFMNPKDKRTEDYISGRIG